MAHEQIVSHLQRELELNGFEAPDELQTKTVTQQATQQNSGKPKPTCHYCKTQITAEISAVNSNEKKTKPKTTRIVLTIAITITVVTRTLTPINEILTKPTQTIQIFKKTEGLDLSTHVVRHGTKHSTEKCYLRANASNRPPLRNSRTEGQNQVHQRNAQNNVDGNVQAAARILN